MAVFMAAKQSRARRFHALFVAVLAVIAFLHVGFGVVVEWFAASFGRLFAAKPPTVWSRPRRTNQVGLRCPYCHDGLTPGTHSECGACRAVFHIECVRETKGCTTLGCRNQRRRHAQA